MLQNRFGQVISAQATFIERVYIVGEVQLLYAIIESGGKQYKVSEGDIVSVELLPVEPDAAMEITKVLALENER